MRFVALIVFLVLGGCASQGPQTKAPVPAFVEKVEPVSLDLFVPLADDPYASYVQPLLRNLGREPFYQLINGKRLDRGYVYSHQIQESDPKKTVFAFRSKDGGDSGYITTGSGNQAIANAFFIQNEQVGAAYALVLKRIKICLVTQSKGLPEYREQRWYFPDAPGYFECTGLTNKNIFKLGTGLPSVLGPYYEEKDTILVFRQFSELQQVVQSLKQQFPYLKVPVIHIR